MLKLPASVAAFFATVPWSTSPNHRLIEKRMLLKAICARDDREAEQIVTRLRERDANGLRHWRWPDCQETTCQS